MPANHVFIAIDFLWHSRHSGHRLALWGIQQEWTAHLVALIEKQVAPHREEAAAAPNQDS
jgi:hypothetical protein